MSVPVIVVLVATGAWSAFIDQVFLSKRQYVDVGLLVRDRVGGPRERVFGGAHTDLRGVVRARDHGDAGRG